MPKILKIVTLWLIPSIAYAQPALDVALKGGVNSATQDHEFRVGRYGGSGGLSGGLQWPLIEQLSLGGQIEILYTPRGSETVFEGEHVGELREHYLDLTITARPEVHLGRASVYVFLGGGLDLLVSASRDDAAGAGQDVTDGFHRIDVALLGAVGIALRLPPGDLGPLRLGTVFAEARHDIGLLDADLGGGFKNRTSSVMLGLSFVVGGQPPPDSRLSSIK